MKLKQLLTGKTKKLLKRIFGIESEKSELVDKYLKNLRGIEIGASSYRDFKLNALNIDIQDNNSPSSPYYLEQMKHGGWVKRVDIISTGDDLPFKDNIWDFVLASHVLEHFYNPIKALKEWYRVTKPGGFICLIVPDKRRTFDRHRQNTTLDELIKRETTENNCTDCHHSVWILKDILELCNYLNFDVIEYQETDTKVHDGFTVVIRK